ncbi:MAG TPA: GNAT family N-acetyltransferase [Crocinitomicaceae bacterium]|nr:GNAT family N-acetyltransferase [Crocinitomicaceae bacterium]
MIREAKPKDVSAIFDLIKGLAEYEKEPEAVINTVENLYDDLFVTNHCEAFVAEAEGKVIGFSLFFTAYSTWKGPIIYLEDLFVLPEYRSTGAGSKLFDAVVQVAKDRKVARMDWQVLEWNTSAIEFYKRKGATIDPEWLNGRFFFEEH